MTKQTKTILIALGVVAVGYFFFQRRKKSLSKGTTKSFDGNDDFFENFDYGNASSFAGDDDFFNAAGRRRVVGGYDAARDRTWIFTEGSRGQGQWVSGRVNVPQGTIIS